MYTLQDVTNEYRRLDRILGIDTSDIQVVYCKGSSQGGYCEIRGGKPKRIAINKILFECPKNEFYDISDTNMLMLLMRYFIRTEVITVLGK